MAEVTEIVIKITWKMACARMIAAFLLLLPLASAEHLLSAITPSAAQNNNQLSRPAVLQQSVLLFRGGADADLDDEEEEDADADEDADDDDAASADDALQNPFLDGAGGLPGMPGGGPGLQDLASTLKDPAALQEALKELQDPAVQQQVKQMLEDPSFQQSMKSYMEQITKDPQFEALKKQTEAMLQEEGFVESMTKAFSELGGALPTPPGGGAAAAEGDDGGEEEEAAEEE